MPGLSYAGVEPLSDSTSCGRDFPAAESMECLEKAFSCQITDNASNCQITGNASTYLSAAKELKKILSSPLLVDSLKEGHSVEIYPKTSLMVWRFLGGVDWDE